MLLLYYLNNFERYDLVPSLTVRFSAPNKTEFFLLKEFEFCKQTKTTVKYRRLHVPLLLRVAVVSPLRPSVTASNQSM